MTIRSEDYDHDKIVAGLEALQESVERLKLEDDWTINDSVDHASLAGAHRPDFRHSEDRTQRRLTQS